MPPRDFSYQYLGILLLSIGPFGGLAAYGLWLAWDPAGGQRL